MSYESKSILSNNLTTFQKAKPPFSIGGGRSLTIISKLQWSLNYDLHEKEVSNEKNSQKF